MLQETGIVIKVLESTADGESWALVETWRQSACGQCHSQQNCGVSTLSQWFGRKAMHIKALNQAQAQVGEEVILSMREDAFLRGSLLVYMLPLLTMFLIAGIYQSFAGSWWPQSELFTILAALIGFLTGLGLLRLYSHRLVGQRQYQAIISEKKRQWRIVENHDENDC